MTFHTLHIPDSPAVVEQAIALLSEQFGADEGALERRQLSGEEVGVNDDTLFYALDGDRFVGMIHLTVSEATRHGLLSGLIVLPECRGTGVGRTLFGMAVAKYDEIGGDTLYLGTSNLAAARMYRTFGFAFETGTNMMYRTSALSLLPLYGKNPQFGTVRDADRSLRVNLIPLVSRRGSTILKDANTGLADNAFLTQLSTAGLFPRYLDILEAGGAVRVVWETVSRLPAALGSRVTINGRRYADAFGIAGTEAAVLPAILESLIGGEPAYARILPSDTEKIRLFTRLGFVPTDETDTLTLNGLPFTVRIYHRA